MPFIEELKKYINKDGFVGNGPCEGQGRTCDNHALFSAEAFYVNEDNTPNQPVIIGYNGKAHKVRFYLEELSQFIDKSGKPYRYPNMEEDISPDNWIALSSAGGPVVNDLMLAFMKRSYGFANKTITGFMYRQLHLLCCQIANGPGLKWYNPLHMLLIIYTGLIIGANGLFTSILDTSNRKLNYILIRGMVPHSFLCKFAATIWWSRLRLQYGEEGIRKVYSIYFGPDHPIAKYAKNPWDDK